MHLQVVRNSLVAFAKSHYGKLALLLLTEYLLQRMRRSAHPAAKHVDLVEESFRTFQHADDKAAWARAQVPKYDSVLQGYEADSAFIAALRSVIRTATTQTPV